MPRLISAALGASIVAWLCAAPAAGAPDQSSPAPPAVRPQPSERTVDVLSVVKLRSKAFAGARSSRTLGPQREGTGVVLDAEGLVLTIGYLILEAETVELSTADGTAFPATVVGYDSTTGFGLLRSLRPLPIAPVRFGQSAQLALRERVLIVGFDGVAPAIVVSRRPFVGYWEYLLEEAIYTAPATVNWSGAALLDREGKLLGIGSLSVNDAVGSDSQVPGNLFVPIDLLKPLMKDLVAHGKSAARPRPWLGVQTQEVQGNVIVTRVSPESPADLAAMRPGDVIIAIGGEHVKGQADFYTRLWSHGAAGVEVRLDVLRAGKVQSVTVTSSDREKYYRVKPTY
ncbi:MAG TPA: S1C family serine protease [Methylomirabilota bacterium]|nr:S1C family serine protease [Methylomirabilota bacterium]